MSVYNDFISYPTTHVNNFFSLAMYKQPERIDMVMESLTSLINTQDVVNTSAIIKKYIPQVLLTDCFNYDNLPFAKELKKTEIAHLFEHILITVLCQLQAQKGNHDVVYNGTTSWNWVKEKKGVFHITITRVNEDDALLHEAVEKSIAILTQIYLSHKASLSKKQAVN